MFRAIERLLNQPCPKRARCRGPALALQPLEGRELLSSGVPFRVWTQNSQLRPTSLWEVISPAFIAANPPAAAIATAVYGAGVPNTAADNEQRARLLLGAINDFDIVALQEVFDPEQVTQIADGAGAEDFHALFGPPRAEIDVLVDEIPYGTNSGLSLLVKDGLSDLYPSAPPLIGSLLDRWAFRHQAEVFEDRGSLLTIDTDKVAEFLAEKGFTLDAVHIGDDPDHYVWVVNTHLNAQDPGVRANQLAQMAAYVDEHTNDGHPVLFLGDFNIAADAGPGSEYEQMMATLGGPVDIFSNPHGNFLTSDDTRNAYDYYWNGAGDPPARIDYILVRQGRDYEVGVTGFGMEDDEVKTDLWHDEGWVLDGGRRSYLSDHFGLWANLTFEVRNGAVGSELRVSGGTGVSNDNITLTRVGDEFVATISDNTGLHEVRRNVADTTAIVIRAGGGNDVVHVETIESPIPITVYGEDGTDTVHLSPTANDLSHLLFSPVRFLGGPGTDTLIADDRATPGATYEVAPDRVAKAFLTLMVPVSTYEGVENVNLRAGRSSLVRVEGTPYGGQTTILGGTTANRFEVGGVARNMDALAGELQLLDNGGTSEMIVNDQGGPAGREYSFANGTLTRTGAANVVTANVNTMAVNTTETADRVFIRDLASSRTLTVNAGGGGDEVRVGSSANSLDPFLGTVVVAGGGGDDKLFLDDQGDGSTNTYTVTAAVVTRSFARVEYAPGTETVTVNAGTNGDTVRVEGTAADTTTVVAAGGGPDVIEVGTAAAGLAAVAGPVSVTGGAATDTLAVHDQGNAGSSEYILTATTIERPGRPTITFGDAAGPTENVTLRAASGGSTVRVRSVGLGTTLTVEGGTGTDAVAVGSEANDLDAVDGTLVVRGNGGTSDTLTLNDQTRAQPQMTYTVRATSVTAPSAPTISYETLEGLIVNGGRGMNPVFNVEGTATATPVTINGGDQLDTINVRAATGPVTVNGGAESDRVVVGSTGNLLAPVAGAVTVNGQAGGYDALTVNDQANTAAATWTVTANGVARTGAGAITYSGAELLTVNGGGGADTYNVRATDAATPLTLNAGGGDDTVIVGSTTNRLDAIKGGVTVNGEGHTLRDTLNLNDQGTPTAGQYTVHWSYVQRSGTAPVGYTGLERLAVNAGTGNDLMTVLGSAAGSTVTVSGGTGTDTLRGPDATNAWRLTAMNGGILGSAVSFSSAENLSGGIYADVFRFNSGTQLSGAIEGNGGGDTLDYSAYTAAAPVTVNLLTGLATSVPNGARGIAHVTGGLGNDSLTGTPGDNSLRGGGGNDTLVGDAGSDVLIGDTGTDTIRGGAGRDLLIGGADADVLSGEAGDDILIGGTTSFDANAELLGVVMSEWTRTDLTGTPDQVYRQRVDHLRFGGGRNGSFRLTATGPTPTVFADAAVDTLSGGADFDWFWDNLVDPLLPRDQLTDRGGPEQVN
jgi:Ca2+-binding RTX toxin-like protein